jgi:hypothetical protein
MNRRTFVSGLTGTLAAPHPSKGIASVTGARGWACAHFGSTRTDSTYGDHRLRCNRQTLEADL